MTLLVEGKRNSLEAELMCVMRSLYSGESSTLITNWSSSFSSRSEDYIEEDQETYNPLVDRFVLSGVEVNQTVYLERNVESRFSFPTSQNYIPSKAAILHGPEVINGYDDGNLFLGVVTSVHNKVGLTYSWYHNGHIICNGSNLCLIMISEPGTYFCTVEYEEIDLKSATVNVQGAQSAYHQETSTKETPTSASTNPTSVSIATLLNAGKLVKPKSK